MATENRIAPQGLIWVCCACGKKSKDRYGDSGTSWDESCMLNAMLCDDATLMYDAQGRVRSANVRED